MYVAISKYDDVIFITSSGKGKNDIDQNPVYPCGFDLENVICVTAVDNMGKLETYTGYGSNLVYAPGSNIYGMLPDGDYIFSNGSSFATAYVTGIVALAKSLNPNVSISDLNYVLKNSHNKIKLEHKTIQIIDARMVLENVKNIQ